MPFANEEPLSLLDVFSEAAPVGLSVLDRDLRFVRVNQALAEMNGVSRENHIGRTIEEILPEAFVCKLVPLLRSVLDTGKALKQREISIEPLNGGRIRHHLESYYPVKRSDGHVEGIGVVVVDITDRKEAEVRLQSLAEAIPQMIFTADANGTTEYCNERWFKYTGADPALGLGRFMRWKAVIHPDDFDRCVEMWMTSIKTGGNYEHEFRVRRHDGAYRWHLGRAVPVRDSLGRISSWFGSLTDIHDHHEEELVQRLFAEAGRVLSSSFDIKATLNELVHMIAPSFADYCTVDLLDDEGRLNRIAVAHADPERARRLHALQDRYPINLDEARGIARVLRTGQPEMYPQWSREDCISNAVNEEHRELLLGCPAESLLIMPLRVRNRALGTLCLAYESRRDFGSADIKLAQGIGERVALAIENALLYEEAHKANRLKDEFLATLSHELRTPLNVILGWTDVLLAEEPTSPLFRQGLEAVARNAHLQSALVSDLLDLSRIVAGKLKMRHEPVSLGEVARTAVDSLRITSVQCGVALSLRAPELPLRVIGDDNRLQQVIWNLVSNSLKFTPQGGEVQVRLSETTDRVLLSVTDTGEGIETVFLPHVFDRFRQQNSTITRRHGGLGLGLSIVRQIVEMHGGWVSAFSAGRGKGATFTVSLPKAPGFSTQLSGMSRDPTPSLAGLRILAVDDSEDSLRLIRIVLEKAGAEVHVASSAAQALEAFSRLQVDLLISDIGMPEEDGLSLLRRLRGLGYQTPAIALTAYVREEERQAALEAGFQIHLAKPAEPHRLLKVVAKFCS